MNAFRSMLLALPLLAAAAQAQTFQLQRSVAVGDVSYTRVEITMLAPGLGELVATGKGKSTVLEVQGDQVKHRSEVLEQTVTRNGQEQAPQDIPASEELVSRSGQPLKIDDSMESPIDMVRMALASAFVLPDGAYTPGQSVKLEVPASTHNVPKFDVEVTYVGSEEVEGETLHKFTRKLTEGGMVSEGDFWLGADGRVMKAELKFAGLPLLVAPILLEGTIKLEAYDGP